MAYGIVACGPHRRLRPGWLADNLLSLGPSEACYSPTMTRGERPGNPVHPVPEERKPALPYVGQSLKRFEDHRLLTGQGQFLDDMTFPGLLHTQ